MASKLRRSQGGPQVQLPSGRHGRTASATPSQGGATCTTSKWPRAREDHKCNSLASSGTSSASARRDHKCNLRSPGRTARSTPRWTTRPGGQRVQPLAVGGTVGSPLRMKTNVTRPTRNVGAHEASGHSPAVPQLVGSICRGMQHCLNESLFDLRDRRRKFSVL